jgi:hypothetical protein
MAANRNLLGLVEPSRLTEQDSTIQRVRCSAAPPLSLWGAALAVLLGNIATAVLAAIFYAISRL